MATSRRSRQRGEGLFEVEATAPAASDYQTWCDEVRPAFEEIAKAGRSFTVYDVKRRKKLPEPPNPAKHWGLFTSSLRRDGVIKRAGWSQSKRPESNGSGVRKWVGVTKRLDAA